MDLLNSLNPQQREAVTIEPGPVLVLAGPGSGKTRVLTHRAAYLIEQLGVQPYHLMAVTFTNKAAREMEERVNHLLGRRAHGLTLGTFHSTCAKILRAEAEMLPVNSNYVIFDADDQLKVVKQVLKDLGIDEKSHHPGGFHAGISRAKNELIFPEDFHPETYREERLLRVYEGYQRVLMTSNALDFDDLLLWMAYLLAENPKIREKYARRFEQILVDEFQDTNMAQYSLLKYLASYHRNIFVVGDTDQAIYRWRGADYRNVMRFESDFPEAKIILLERNYRSTQTILDVAMSVINKNENRTPKSLFTDRGPGKRVTIREFYDEREQANFIVNRIANQVAIKSAELSDFAIMYRTNAQSRQLEEAFISANLPYKLVGAQRFYGRREVKDIIAYLRLIFNLHDEFSLARVIGTPPRGIGTKTHASLRREAQKLNLSPGELLLRLGRNPDGQYARNFSSREAGVLADFGALLLKWTALLEDTPPAEIMDQVLDDVQYKQYIDDGTEEGMDRWENVMELRRHALSYHHENLRKFLEDTALVSDQDTIDENARVPTLLTLHAAKGLEFRQVFIVGLNEGVLPHKRSFEDPEAMEEERRLFYVGITRAMDQLVLTHTFNRYTFGYMEPVEPSRYYRDVPYDLREDQVSDRTSPDREDVFRPWDDGNRVDDEPRVQKFSPGMKVEHPKWGRGVILGSQLQDGDEIVDIFFDSVGLKKVISSLANLKTISEKG